MEKQLQARYGLSLNQTASTREQSNLRSVTLESESLGVLGAVMCLVGLLFVLVDIGQ
jgi:hypothetical protein